MKHYFHATRLVVDTLSGKFKSLFPDQYSILRSSFEAGKIEESDPGPWLGRALVWKMQVAMHRDGLDGVMGAILNTGCYSGGCIYFPGIGLKLSWVSVLSFTDFTLNYRRYGPGDIIYGLFDVLQHCVAEWAAKTPNEDDPSMTAGRVGYVFFSPQSSVDLLIGKEPGWHIKTNKGQHSGRYFKH
jgi:hypothetical protein